MWQECAAVVDSSAARARRKDVTPCCYAACGAPAPLRRADSSIPPVEPFAIFSAATSHFRCFCPRPPYAMLGAMPRDGWRTHTRYAMLAGAARYAAIRASFFIMLRFRDRRYVLPFFAIFAERFRYAFRCLRAARCRRRARAGAQQVRSAAVDVHAKAMRVIARRASAFAARRGARSAQREA